MVPVSRLVPCHIKLTCQIDIVTSTVWLHMVRQSSLVVDLQVEERVMVQMLFTLFGFGGYGSVCGLLSFHYQTQYGSRQQTLRTAIPRRYGRVWYHCHHLIFVHLQISYDSNHIHINTYFLHNNRWVLQLLFVGLFKGVEIIDTITDDSCESVSELLTFNKIVYCELESTYICDFATEMNQQRNKIKPLMAAWQQASSGERRCLRPKA